MNPSDYRRGLHEIGDHLHAYLQPDGSWGWSNAGLIGGDGASLLVDTLFDLQLTQEMLDSMAPAAAAAPISTVVNTHGNGDHCYGNQLVADAEIIATTAAAEEMAEVTPQVMAAMNAAEGELGELFRSFFGQFHFDGIQATPPTRTFDGRLDLEVGRRAIELIEVGPAHTRGDALVYVPDANAVFTGDILFINGTPIVWAGPLSNWVAACDLMLGMNLDVIVPGHGPVTDKAGVASVRDYLAFVDQAANERFAAGLDAWEAARDIAAELRLNPEFRAWGEFGRITVNVDTVYKAIDPNYVAPDVVERFRRMAELERPLGA